MGRVVISSAEESPLAEFPQLTGVGTNGRIKSRGVIAAADRGLFLWMHELSPGAEIHWEAPPIGHVAYVWSGDVEVGRTVLGADAALIVEHNGRAGVRAGSNGATLAHFHEREAGHKPPRRAGGNVHVLGPEGILSGTFDSNGIDYTLYADSDCPTCELWMHARASHVELPPNGRHFHSEDEIMLIRAGGMLLGRRTLGRGTALAIDADTIYTFANPPEGLSFVNFRSVEPYYVRVSPKNEPLHAPICERTLIRDSALHHYVSIGPSAP